MRIAADKQFVLTEWDFDMPRSNRFHDPITPKTDDHDSTERDDGNFDIECAEDK